jgi:GntR family transcriptional regulator, carbon starvation induced regulator
VATLSNKFSIKSQKSSFVEIIGVKLYLRDLCETNMPNNAVASDREDRSDERGSGTTLTTTVYQRLREDVLAGALAPGQKLRMEALRDRYGAGASPVREALNRLLAEGLVSQVDQKGFRVAPVSIEELRELTTARLWVTRLALREAIARGDVAWEERIVLAFHRFTRAMRRSTSGAPIIGYEVEKHHREFHSALLAACGSRWITDFADMLFDCARRYQRRSLTSAARPRDIDGEHRAIINAVLARDVELAIKLHDEHIMRTVEIIADIKTISDTGGTGVARLE